MSIHWGYVAKCDRCALVATLPCATYTQARQGAADTGWSMRSNYGDLCPTCVDELGEEVKPDQEPAVSATPQ